MSSDAHPNSLSRRATLLGLVGLGGCGFSPALGTDGPAQALRDQVAVSAPDTVAGFRLRTAIGDRLGRGEGGAFQLAVVLNDTRAPAAVTEDGDTTRFDLIGQAEWVLTSTNTGATFDQGSVRSFSSYSATGSTVATQVAADAAAARLSRSLADLIVADLILAVAL